MIFSYFYSNFRIFCTNSNSLSTRELIKFNELSPTRTQTRVDSSWRELEFNHCCDCSNSIYDGTFCKIDKCEHDNPCQNGGNCIVNSETTPTEVICDCSNSEYDSPYCTPSICDDDLRTLYNLGSTSTECKAITTLNLRAFQSGDYEWDIRYPIEDVPYLGDLIYVEEINLSGNQIRQLTSRTFENNISLKKLDLSNNPIRELSDDSFSKLTELLYLIINDHQIKNIGETLFKNNWRLVELDLRNGLLETIKPNTGW